MLSEDELTRRGTHITHLYFTDEETEARKGHSDLSRSYRLEERELGCKPRWSGLRASPLSLYWL